MRVMAPSNNFFVFTLALIKCNIIPMAVGSWTAAQRCKHNCVFPHPAWPAISVTVPGLNPPLDVSLHPSARSTPSLNVTKLLLNLLVWSNESVLNFKITIMYKWKCYAEIFRKSLTLISSIILNLPLILLYLNHDFLLVSFQSYL